MPELPEVETIRLQLTQLIPGVTIKDIKILKEKSFSGDKKLLFGATITDLLRLGKMLVIKTDKKLALAVHLKMTGQLIFKSQKTSEDLPNKFTRVIISFTDGSKLYFNDVRRFGWMKIIETIEDLKKKIGPDPLKVSNSQFYKILKQTKKPVKFLLMDQEKLAGVGNIYSCESLFLGGVNPNVSANKLTQERSEKLLDSLKKVLNSGIKWRGASKQNFRNAYGEKGEMQEHFSVYGREGEKCLNNCGGEIMRIKMGGRSTFVCPVCQQ